MSNSVWIVLHRWLAVLLLGASSGLASAMPGADVPWITYEAEDMATTGVVLGPKYGPNVLETEASGRKCVRLEAPGQYVEFKSGEDASSIVVRYSLPDSPDGKGLDSTISLYVNGKFKEKLPVTSRYTWLYGDYPFSNNPAAGKPRNFFDEVRLKGLEIHRGDVVRLQKDSSDAARYCIIDLVDLEQVGPPLPVPANSLCICDPRFGAAANGVTDDTTALKNCIAAAKEEGKTVWVPAGTYLITGDIDLHSDVTIQGAGMWHSTFMGDPGLYSESDRRVRFTGAGSNIHLADFAIVGKLNCRSDSEPNDGLEGSFGTNSTISRIWVEHTKTGAWIVNSSGLMVEGCRFRDTIADGINFCVGMRGSTISNCTARGTGDDCFAVWPATYASQKFTPGLNVIRHCTGQMPFLANGVAIYGAEGNRVEDCLFKDISYGCGVLISTTFPVGENEFSGTTVVQHCELIRCGGYDHVWQWRAALQVCLDQRNISGVDINNVNISDSISDGLSIIAHGDALEARSGTLSNTFIDHVQIPNYGLGVEGRHSLWVTSNAKGSATVSRSNIAGSENSSANFRINVADTP